jgi:hypothetical protein
VSSKSELFDKIPELVQKMQNAIAGGTGGTGTGGKVGISFEGDTMSTRDRRTVISGLREALQTQKINLIIDEKTEIGRASCRERV